MKNYTLMLLLILSGCASTPFKRTNVHVGSDPLTGNMRIWQEEAWACPECDVEWALEEYAEECIIKHKNCENQ